jgi:hypothetical protein
VGGTPFEGPDVMNDPFTSPDDMNESFTASEAVLREPAPDLAGAHTQPTLPGGTPASSLSAPTDEPGRNHRVVHSCAYLWTTSVDS